MATVRKDVLENYERCSKEGREAAPGSPCPYGMAEMMKRNIWLAAHYDEWGKEAWENARRPKQEYSF